MTATAGALVAALAFAFGTAAPAATETPEQTKTATTETAKTKGKVDETVTVVNHADGVAAIVNDSVISDYDLRQRMALFMATSGIKPTEDMMKKVRDQVLEQLEDERLQLLEAQKKNVTVSSSEVDKAIENITSENGLDKKKLEAILGDAGVHMATLRAQIAAQIAWSKLVQSEYGDRVDISPEDVDSEMRRINEGADKPHFRVAEIFLQVDNPEDDDKIRKKMDDIEEQLRLGAPFNAVARQLSQHPTAAQGGDLGLVTEGQLLPELNTELMKMHTGEVSQPIRAAGGYYILFVRQRFEPQGTVAKVEAPAPTTPPGTLPLARVLLPIGAKPPAALRDNALQAAGMLRQHFNGCEKLREIVAQMKGAVYMNLGVMRLTDLSGEMQTALKSTQSGESTQPFLSAAGVEIIVRCDKAAPKITTWTPPTRDEIQRQLFEEQIGVLARRYMRDLRRNADVQVR